MRLEELKNIEPVGVIVQDGNDHGLIESEVIQGISTLPVGTKIYTAEQIQEYAKAQAKKVFWYAAKGTSEDRALLARAIDYVFKEVQDEEV